jgi:Ca2+-binding RTX toxin-like protein
MSEPTLPLTPRKVATSAAAVIAELKRKGFTSDSVNVDPITLEEIGGKNPLGLVDVDAHHVIPLAVLNAAKTDTNAYVTRNLVMLSYVFNGFDIDDVVKNGLMLPSVKDGGKQLLLTQPDVALHGSSHTAYRNGLFASVNEAAAKFDDLYSLVEREDFDELIIGKNLGYSDGELGRLAALSSQVLDAEVARTTYGLTNARSLAQGANSLAELKQSGVLFLLQNDPLVTSKATQFNMSSAALLEALDQPLSQLQLTPSELTNLTSRIETTSSINRVSRYTTGLDFFDPNLKVKLQSGEIVQALDRIVAVQTGTALPDTKWEAAASKGVFANLQRVGTLNPEFTKGARVVAGTAVKGLNVLAAMQDPVGFAAQVAIEKTASLVALRAGVGATLAEGLSSYAGLALTAGVGIYGVRSGGARLTDPLSGFMMTYRGEAEPYSLTIATDLFKKFGHFVDGTTPVVAKPGGATRAVGQLQDSDGTFITIPSVEGEIVVIAPKGGQLATDPWTIVGFARTLAARIVHPNQVNNAKSLSDVKSGAGSSSSLPIIYVAGSDGVGTQVGTATVRTGVSAQSAALRSAEPNVTVQMDNGTSVFTEDGTLKVDDSKVSGQSTKVTDKVNNRSLNFAQAGTILGDAIGSGLIGDKSLGGRLGSVAVSALGTTLGGVLNDVTHNVSITKALDNAVAALPGNFAASLAQSGVGALSSYLTAELVNGVGIGGFAGELANAVGGAYINALVMNLPGLLASQTSFAQVIGNVDPLTLAGSFLGSKLAGEVIKFETVGGQIGSAVGASLSVLAASQLGWLGGPAGFAIATAVAFVGNIVGGLIGSVFGGTPRSGADVEWDSSEQRFIVANVYSKKGGSKEAAQAMASSAAETFNQVVEATGGKLMNPEAVQAGNYGMRKSDYVYRETSTREVDAITKRFSGKNGAPQLIAYGVYQGLSDPDFRIAGGDIFVKRALYNGLAGLSAGNFESNVLLGNIASARSYENYLASSTAIGALIAAEPDSVFAAETALTLARAVELGLTRRAASDWYGGFNFLMEETGSKPGQVVFGFNYDPASDRVSRQIGLGTFGVGDAIDVAGQTLISGSAGADNIRLNSTVLNAPTGTTNVGLMVDGRSFSAGARTIAVAATIDAGDGNDTVYASDLGDNVFGGLGNDTLYGGRLDDWLLGGDGDDTLDAGPSTPGMLGGDGNYLSGGEGNDILRGREGSDWLDGGDGTDTLDAGAGDDVLVGGAGNGDSLKGAAGDDQYLVRRGDGADIVDEEGSSLTLASQGGGTGDVIAARMSSIAAGRIKADWAGRSAGVSGGAVDGGEDAVVFGNGIEVGDIRLQRSAEAGGADLLVVVMETIDGVERDSGTRLTLRNWFTDSFKRIEWLKFSDGTELRIGDITSFIVGGAGNDVLIGTSGNDFVFGGAGNDKLFLMAGDDVGNGGTGDDMVSGGDDRDLVIGGLGNDDLLGGRGADALSGDAGTDMLYGGADNDILSGGRGDGDEVVGGGGDDRFKYSRGDGQDTIFDEFLTTSWQTVLTGSTWAQGYVYNQATGEVTDASGFKVRANLGTAEVPNLSWQGRFDYDPASGTLKRFVAPASGSMVINAGTDTLEFAPGIDIQDVILRRVGTDLVMVIADDDLDITNTSKVSDSLTIKDWFATGLAGQIERMAFYQTGVLDTSAAKRNLLGATDGADTLVGTAMDDWITAGAGDDFISGGQGADILSGNAGSDTLRGEAGDDIIYGGTGNDILDGGAGKDVLIGGAGNDTASYASATAAVRAQLSASWSNSGDGIGDEYNAIEGLTGGSGNDVLGGDVDQNELTGGAGNDSLYGGGGDDTYVWNFSGSVGDGADTIYDAPFIVEEAVTTGSALTAGYAVASWASTGVASPTSGQTYWRLQIKNAAGEIVYDYDKFSKAGSAPTVPTTTEYVTTGWRGGFARTNGYQVTRQKFDAADGGIDTLELGAGLSLNDLNFVWSGNDLIVRKDGNSATQILIQGQKVSLSRIETLQLADGQAISLANVLVASSATQLLGSASDDLLVGQWGANADNLAGGDGADALVGYAGDDQLYGQGGDDVLEGGAGADRLDGGTNNAVGTSVAAGDTARYARSAAGVTIDLTTTGAQAGSGDALGDVLVGIENLVGSSFADTLNGDAGGNRLAGLDGDDTLRGGSGDDVLIGDGGADNLYGDDGIDALSGGDGNDQLFGGLGDDRLDGGEGEDKLYGEGGKDSLTAGTGNDLVDGGADDDVLSGDAGDDQLLGGDGNDTLSGGAGNDALTGGSGNDTYLFSATSGADTITDAVGANILAFDQSVSFDRLWMTRSGNDLRVSVIGGDAIVSVTGFFVGQATMRAIQTPTHAFYLDNADSLRLVTAMTAQSGATPTIMPVTISSMLATFWHVDGKAAPTAPTAPRALATNEDANLAVSGGWGVIDHDGGPLTYSAKADAVPTLGRITGLNATTGAFTYVPLANLNGTDTFSLLATDADGQSVELQIQLVIAPSNDAPGPVTITGSGRLTILEGGVGTSTAIDTIVGGVSSVDPDGDVVTFSLVDDAGGRFRINASGTISVAQPTLLDYETKQAHQITIKASDGRGGETQTTLSVSVTNLNELNALPATAAALIDETVAVGTVVATVIASDADGPSHAFGQQRYFFVSNNVASANSSDGRYSIDPLTGSVKTRNALDYEAGNVSVAYKVVARDNAGVAPYNEATQNLTIAINNVNEQTTLPAAQALGIAENVAIGTVVGTIKATDPDGTSHLFGQQRYYFQNGTTTSDLSSDGRYAINATSGVIITKGPLDFEAANPSVVYTVIARDNAGNAGYTQASSSLTIGVTNLNEANALPPTYAMSVAENVALGTPVGKVTATDLDSTATVFGQQRYYFWDGTTANAKTTDGRYQIDAATGAVTVAGALNYEAANTVATYQVIARDNAGAGTYNQVQTGVTISITDVNEANSLPATYTMATVENGSVGAAVGKVQASDLDGAATTFGQQRYYFWDGTTAAGTSNDGLYKIDAISGAVTTAVSPNFEAKSTASYRVIARDNAGGSSYNQVETLVTISVTDVNEANALPTTLAMVVAENVAVGSTVTQILATDLDTAGSVFAQQRYFFLNGAATSDTSSDGRYTIDPATGIIKTKIALDFEAGTPSSTYTVVARDNAGAVGGFQAQTAITITVADANEAPTAMTWAPTTIATAERDRLATGAIRDAVALADFVVADPDTAGGAFASYTFTVNDSRFEMVGNSLRLKRDASLDYEAGATVSVIVTAKDADITADSKSIAKTVSITVQNRDDVLDGTAAADTLIGQKNRDIISAFGGNDVIDGGAGDDLLLGGAGEDRLIGGIGNDEVNGGDDNDVLLGGVGNDVLRGDLGNDVLYGDDGNDTLTGGDGNDVLTGGAGKDVFDGGSGIDRVDYSVTSEGVAASTGVVADLLGTNPNADGDTFVGIEELRGTQAADQLYGDAFANAMLGEGGSDVLEGRGGNDMLDGGIGDDQLSGGDGNDLLTGGAGNDVIYGGAGDDQLLGGDGNDTLYAESGDDLLDGGAGDDSLSGGLDNDTYLMTRSSGADTIWNYDPSGADVDVIGLKDASGVIADKDLWFERSGDDMIVSVVGTTSSARIKNWYTMAGVDGANYKIDFIIAGERQSKTINVEALVALMATRTRPADLTARDAIMADTTYRAKWATYWGSNSKPVITAISSQTTNEDQAIVLTVKATDDITPGTGISIAAEVTAGGAVIPLSKLVWGQPDGQGNRTLTITPAVHVAGTATIRLIATDVGGAQSDPVTFNVTVKPVADKPVIGSFVGGSGTSGQPGGVPLTVAVSFPDTDGSELQELWITGVPAGVTLSAGTYESATATWKLTPAQASGLKVFAPAGWSQDLTLGLTARATEGGATASAAASATVLLNAPPTSIALSGSINENAADGTAVGTVTGIDPDGDALTYALIDNAGGRFAITAAGALSVMNGSLLNYEAASSHAITVRATDRFGQFRDQSLSVAVNNLNEAPSLPTGPSQAFFDETALGSRPANSGVVVATFSLSDPDGTAPTLEFTANPGNWFTIVGNTVRFNAPFDYETFRAAGTYGISDYNKDGRVDALVANVGLRATDGSLASAAINLQVLITDVDEAPVISSGRGAQYLDETGLGARPANGGSIVATFGVTDPDGTTPSIQLATNPNNWFYIADNTVRLRAGVSLDFETLRRSGAYAVSDLNGDGRMDATVAELRVRAVPDIAPILATGATLTAGQQALSRDGRYTLAYQNDGNLVLYGPSGFIWNSGVYGYTPGRLTMQGDGNLVVYDNNGVMKWMTGATSSGGGSLSVDPFGRLTVNGSDGLELWASSAPSAGLLNTTQALVQVNISDVNERPDNLVLEASNIFVEANGSDSHAGLLQARFGVTDPDASGARLVILGGNDNGWFRINEDGRHLQVTGANWSTDWMRANMGNGAFQYDMNKNGMLEARIARLTLAAQDPSGLLSDPYTYDVYIENKNEAPWAPTNGGWKYFDETGLTASSANAGTVVATMGLADPDGTMPSLRLISNPNNWFYIENNQIKFSAGFNHDFDWFRAAGYSINDWSGDGRLEAHIADVVVRANDGQYDSPDTLVKVFISNVNEAPLAPTNGGWKFFDETGLTGNSANAGTVVATMGLPDPDGTTPSLRLVTNPNNWFYVEGAQIKFAGGTNYDFEWFRANGNYGIYDWNNDGRLEAHIADVLVRSNDGQYDSPDTLLQVFVSDVNERPNPLVMEANNTFQETTNGESHSERLLTRFGLSDQDGNVDHLEIVGGNGNNWFRVNGNHIQINTGVNWTADWLRANKGSYGVDAGFNYDTNGNGLREIRIATLSVVAVDTQGARSDAYSYNVLIEDKNEAPVFSQGSFDWWTPETAGWYTYLGTVSGSDIDGPASELRYNFSNWNRYYDSNLARNVSLTPDGRFVMDDNGNMWTNGAQSFNWEDGGQRDFGYQVMIYDKGWGANNAYSYSSVGIHLYDVDEQHGMHDKTVGWQENVASTLVYGVSIADMVDDPDHNNSNIYYTFADGSNDVGGWHLDQASGILSFSAFDYEALTDVYQDQSYVDEYGNYQPYYAYVGTDAGRATFRLGVTARSRSAGVSERSATLTVSIQNSNEGPIVSSTPMDGWGGASSENQIYQDGTGQFRVYRRTRGRFAQITGIDPERAGGVSVQVVGGSTTSPTTISASFGYDSTIGSAGVPQIQVDSQGYLSLYVPNDGKNEWRGGFNSQKYTLTYNFTVRVTDANGVGTDVPVSLTLFQRNIDIDPIIVDLDGDGVELIDASVSSALFDMDGDGILDQTSWFSGDDGMLVLDRDGNGKIEGISEISFRSDGDMAQSELEALEKYDTDANGFFDKGDEAYASFRLWRDLNQDGTSDLGEIQTLQEAGITGISLTRSVVNKALDDGSSIIMASEVLLSDGSQTIANDVNFVYEPSALDEEVATPIILDLDGDGITIAPLATSKTTFDMVGDGKLRVTAWMDPGDAFLVRDRNGNGMVDNINDISFVGDKVGALTDLDGLAAFDDTGDMILDARDQSFVGFNVWRDTNANGITDAGELLTLVEAGISSIGLVGSSTGESISARAVGESVTFNTAGFSYVDGRTGALADVGLAYTVIPVGAAKAANVAYQTIATGAGRKAAKFRLSANGGAMTLRPNSTSGAIDAGAGRVGPASMLDFSGTTVGLLDAIILDLDGDGLATQSRKKSRAAFDMDNDGVADDTGWIGKGDGFLVLDRDGDGMIGSAAELTFLAEKGVVATSFAGLALLDANKDGKIDKDDARYSELKVWRDANRDGVTNQGELLTLAEAGISSLSLKTSALTSSVKPGGNLGLSTAIFTKVDGSTATMGEAALAFRPSSRMIDPDEPADALAGVPATSGSDVPAIKNDGTSRSATLGSLPAKLPALSDATLPSSTARSEAALCAGAFGEGASLVSEAAFQGAMRPSLAAAQLVEAMSSFGASSGTDDRWAFPSNDRSSLLNLAVAR